MVRLENRLGKIATSEKFPYEYFSRFFQPVTWSPFYSHFFLVVFNGLNAQPYFTYFYSSGTAHKCLSNSRSVYNCQIFSVLSSVYASRHLESCRCSQASHAICSPIIRFTHGVYEQGDILNYGSQISIEPVLKFTREAKSWKMGTGVLQPPRRFSRTACLRSPRVPRIQNYQSLMAIGQVHKR